MAAFTTQTPLFGLPPLDGVKPPPADLYARGRFLAAQRRDPPAQSTQNVWQQAQSFVNGVYVAVTAIMGAMSAASVVVMKRQGAVGRKSLNASGTGSGESDWVPAESDHPLVRLFEHVNSNQTLSDYLAEKVLCRCLFGSSVEYVAEDKAGNPSELWNLRPNYLSAIPLSPQYPAGAWRYTVPGPFLWSYTAGSVTFDRRETIWHKLTHPMFPWEGYSPTTAGAKYIDFLNSVVDSRQMAMDHGFSPDVIVKMFQSSDKEMTRFQAEIEAKYAGANRGQRVIPVDAERVEIERLSIEPDKMAYGDAYTQAEAAVQNTFGVSAMVTGATPPGSYAAFYAAVRAFHELKLKHEASSIGQHYTKHVVRERYGPDYKIEVKLPPIMDPDLQQRQWATLTGATSAVTFKINEVRASLDMPPMDGGDVTPAEYNQQLQMKQQQAQQQMQMAAQGQAQGLPGLTDGAGSGQEVGGDQAAQDAISGGVLEALGVGGAEGGAVRKAFDRSQPRDDHGRWVSPGELRAAAHNPAKADTLRATITDPDERAKFDAAVGRVKPLQHATAPTHEFHAEEGRALVGRVRGTLARAIKAGDPAAVRAAGEKGRRLFAAHWGEAADRLEAQLEDDFPQQPGQPYTAWRNQFAAAVNAVTAAGEAVTAVYDDAVADLAALAERAAAGESPADLRGEFDASLGLIADEYDDRQNAVWDAVEAVTDKLGRKPGWKLGRYFKSWTRFTTKTGGVGARNEAGREVYGDDAEAALAAQGKPDAAEDDKGAGSAAPQKHRVAYTVGGKPQQADIEAASPDEAKQIVEALGGKVTGVGGTTAGKQPGNNVSSPKPAAGQGVAAAGKQTGNNSGDLIPEDNPDPNAPLPPKAQPIAKRAAQQAKVTAESVAKKIDPATAKQVLASVREWGQKAADANAAAVAARHNLSQAEGRALFLHVLAVLVRILPGPLGRVGGAAAQIGGMLASRSEGRARGEAMKAEGEAGRAKAGFEQAKRTAADLGVEDDTPAPAGNRITGGAGGIGNGPPRPKNRAGAGSLPRRVGKSLAAYFDQLVEEV